MRLWVTKICERAAKARYVLNPSAEHTRADWSELVRTRSEMRLLHAVLV